MPIIDCHTHAYQAEDVVSLEAKLGLIDSALPEGDPNRWKLTNDGRLASLAAEEQAAGVDRFVLLPVATKRSRVSELNRWSARAAERHPQIIPFATLHPLADNPAADLAEALDLGLAGVKMHSLLQRFDLTSPPSLEIIRKVEAAGLPLLLDTLHAPGLAMAKPHLAAFRDEFAPFATDPEHLATLSRACPDLTIIAAHMGCLYGWEHIEPLHDLPNIHFDLAYVDRLMAPDRALDLIRRHGADRVLWGTDAPWRAVAPALEWFGRLDLTPAEREMIASGNLLRIITPA